jgi:hypothetical protein
MKKRFISKDSSALTLFALSEMFMMFMTVFLLVFFMTGCGKVSDEGVGNTETATAVENIQEDEVPTSDIPEGGTDYITDDVITTDLIQITIPEGLKGTTYALELDDRVEIYDKALVDEGWPGLVFSVGVSSDCDVYCGGMYVKQGEINGEDGTIYNVGKGFASEIQWDYNEPDMPESYKKLEDAADDIIANIKGVGGNVFVYKAGTKGEELYPEIIARYVTAINEGWDPNKYVEEDMSSELSVLVANAKDPFSSIGYAYFDINNDGIDELLVADTSGGTLDGTIYDIYTMVDRVPTHVVSGASRDRYYAFGGYAICNEYSGGALEYGSIVSVLTPNTTELFQQYAYKYDGYEDEENPWFTGYSDGEWEPMSEEDYNSGMERINSGKMTLDYMPFN